MNKDSTSAFGGPLEIGFVDPKTKLWTPVAYKEHNLIVDGASDIVGRILSGDSSYVPSVMYFEYSNGAYSAPANTDKTVDISYYTGLSLPNDYMRVAIDSTPALSASSVSYETNIVTFMAATGDGVGRKGSNFGQASSSTVYGGALIASPTGDISGDVLYARFYFSTPIAKQDGSLFGIRWPMRFTL